MTNRNSEPQPQKPGREEHKLCLSCGTAAYYPAFCIRCAYCGVDNLKRTPDPDKINADNLDQSDTRQTTVHEDREFQFNLPGSQLNPMDIEDRYLGGWTSQKLESLKSQTACSKCGRVGIACDCKPFTPLVTACPQCGRLLTQTCHHDGEEISATQLPRKTVLRLLLNSLENVQSDLEEIVKDISELSDPPIASTI